MCNGTERRRPARVKMPYKSYVEFTDFGHYQPVVFTAFATQLGRSLVPAGARSASRRGSVLEPIADPDGAHDRRLRRREYGAGQQCDGRIGQFAGTGAR